MIRDFLDTKPLFYTKFDPNRIVKAYKLIKDKIKHPKRVHLIGTNGKGSTGRALAFLAYKSGLNVAHFTSPHIFDFRERFWINNKFATIDSLNRAHERLIKLLGSRVAVSLSYFEYQTLLAFVLFEDVDLQVIEAGLGGEYDATSVVDYNLTVFTPIGLDHATFLGNSLQKVATTKLKAMSNINLLAPQKDEVITIAKSLSQKIGAKIYLFDDLLDKIDTNKLIEIAKAKIWPNYLVQNIMVSLMGLNLLKIDYNIDNLKDLKLFGRFYRLMQNVIIDVGHNPLAAKAIFDSLDKRVDLIFNILDDKDAKEVLNILKPKIDRVWIIKLNNKRAMKEENLINILNDLKIKYDFFDGKLDKNRDYLVFGSFYVVEKFLEMIGVDSIETE